MFLRLTFSIAVVRLSVLSQEITLSNLKEPILKFIRTLSAAPNCLCRLPNVLRQGKYAMAQASFFCVGEIGLAGIGTLLGAVVDVATQVLPFGLAKLVVGIILQQTSVEQFAIGLHVPDTDNLQSPTKY